MILRSLGVLTIGIAAGVGLAASATAAPFPPRAAQSFMDGCRKGYAQALKNSADARQEAESVCTCGLKQVEQTTTPAEFVKATQAAARARGNRTLSTAEQKSYQQYRQIQSRMAAACIDQETSSTP